MTGIKKMTEQIAADNTKSIWYRKTIGIIGGFASQLSGMQRFAFLSLFILIFLVFFGSRIAPYNPEEIVAGILIPPNGDHWF